MKLIFFLRIIRWPNLLIVAATMLLMRFCVLQPHLETNGLFLILSNSYFYLLTLSVVLIAASGYIINDLNDVEIDNVNKPEKVIAGKYLSVKFLDNIYLFLNFSALAIAIYISYSIGLRAVAIIILLAAGLLYFYSTTYKHQVIIGNIIVAVLSALIPVVVYLFDMPLIREKYRVFESANFNFNYIIAWFGFYAGFAFIISLAREIIKDIEDFEGDASYGKNTIPVKFGIRLSKTIAIILLSILLLILSYCTFKYLNNLFSVIYIIPMVIAPIAYIIFLVSKASVKQDYTNASKWCKIAMITGIAYTLLLRFVILNPSIYQ